MTAILDIDGTGYGNLFTSPYAPGTHNAFVIVSLQEWIGVVNSVYTTATIFKTAFFNTVFVAVILERTVSVFVTGLAAKIMASCQQFQNNPASLHDLVTMCLNHHAFFSRSYTGCQKQRPIFAFDYTHTAGASQP
jgi:hypothetical protein